MHLSTAATAPAFLLQGLAAASARQRADREADRADDAYHASRVHAASAQHQAAHAAAWARRAIVAEAEIERLLDSADEAAAERRLLLDGAALLLADIAALKARLA